MAIYIFYISNDKERKSTLYIENFENEKELIEYKNNIENRGFNKINIFTKASSLADIISEFLFDEDENCHEPIYYYTALLNKFGQNELLNQFPNEQFNQDLIDNIYKMYNEKIGEIIEEYHQSKEFRDEIYMDLKNPWE